MTQIGSKQDSELVLTTGVVFCTHSVLTVDACDDLADTLVEERHGNLVAGSLKNTLVPFLSLSIEKSGVETAAQGHSLPA